MRVVASQTRSKECLHVSVPTMVCIEATRQTSVALTHAVQLSLTLVNQLEHLFWVSLQEFIMQQKL